MATQMKLDFNTKERVLLGMTLLLVPIFLSEIYGVGVMRQTEAFRTNPDMPSFLDLGIGILISFVIVVLRVVLTKAFQPLGRLILSPTKRVNPDRVERFSSVLFKFLYFTGITSVGYYIMKDEDWFPTVLGGSGEVWKAYLTLDTPPTFRLKYYFLVQLGYHFHSLLYMLFLTPIRNDFLEMLLHHVTTIILIGGSYLANYTAKGALVAYVHDIGDVTGYAIKSIVDTGNTPLVIVMYIILLVSWGYSRLYVYPMHLVYNAIYVLPVVNPHVSMVFLQPGNVLLCILQVLHVYWYFLFLVMGYTLLKTGKQEDIQNKIHDKTGEAKKTK